MTRKRLLGIVCVFALAIPFLILTGIFGVDRVTPPSPLTEDTETFSVNDALLIPQKAEMLPLVLQEQLADPDPEPEPEPETEPETEPEPEVEPQDTEEQNEDSNAPEMPGEPDEEVPGEGSGESDESESGDNAEAPSERPTGNDDPEEPGEPSEPEPENPEDSRPSGDPDPTDPGHGQEDQPDEQEKKEPTILTDLRTQTLAAAEGDGDTFPLSFSAEILDGETDMELCVFYRSVSPTGAFLDSGELTATASGYEMSLEEGTHTFSFRIRQNGKLLPAPQESRIVTWTTNKFPPTISAYLGKTALSDGCTVDEETQEPLLKVSALDYQGNRVPASGITVWLDGARMNNYTGSTVKEYKLWLTPPDEGDCAIHTITVQARDAEGQTSEETYTVAFTSIAEGVSIGWATVYFDCTTVGLGYLDEGITVPIRQGYPASYVLTAALEEAGWDCTYSGGLGGPDDRIGGFYLKSIVGPDFSFANPSRLQPELWTCIQNDGIEIDPSLKPNGALRNGSELGEFDFTSGSGWMYEVNGYYPGRGLSEYYLQDGDVLTLRFTLALGKDIGQSAKNSGRFDSYCRTWVSDRMYPEEHPSNWFETEEISASCLEDGERRSVCPCCGEEKSEVIPALGHEFEYETEAEPTCTEPGLHRGACIRCGETEEAELPPLGHSEAELSRTEPNCTQDGEVLFRCERCGEERTEMIPAAGHRYEYEVTAEADCETAGVRRGICEVCGDEISEDIPVLGHEFENGFCLRCGAEDPQWTPAEPPREDDEEDEENKDE